MLIETQQRQVPVQRNERLKTAAKKGLQGTAQRIAASDRAMHVVSGIVRSPRTQNLTERFLDSRILETGIKRKIEKMGFLEVKEAPEVALQARVDTLRTVWALKGIGDRMLRKGPETPPADPDNPRITVLTDAAKENGNTTNARMDALMRRINVVPQRRELLDEVLTDARSDDPDKALEAKRRLSTVMDIVDGEFDKKNPQGRKAVILTQTAYLLGTEEKTEAKGGKGDRANKLKRLAIELATGSVPYMGAAVLYSELMATGKFSDIEFIDFHDKKAIEAMLARGDREFAFISGATTFDGVHVEKLNEQLSENGLTVVNGGVAAGIETDPQTHFLDKGASVFVGDLEGAADQLVDKLIEIRDERENGEHVVFVRQGHSRARDLRKTGVPMIELKGLSERALLHVAYDEKREIEEGRLADRMIALEMMRGEIHYGDKSYEQPPKYKFHQTSTSYGCPEKCDFCATVPLQGVNMRQRSLESLQLEWEASESPSIAIVDQNFGANGRSYVTEVLELAKSLDKRVGFECELLFFSDPAQEPWEIIKRPKPTTVIGLPLGAQNLLVPEQRNDVPQEFFFDGSAVDGRREQLLHDVVLGIEVGLEQPEKVSGTIPGGKDPKFFKPALEKMATIGVPIFGTVVVGMPEQLFDNQDAVDRTIIPTNDKLGTPAWDEMVETWAKWIEDNKVPAPLIFGFSTYRGTKLHERLAGMDLLEEETADNPYPQIKGIARQAAVRDISDRIYTLESAKKRLADGNYDFPRLWKLFAYNILAGKAFRDEMG